MKTDSKAMADLFDGFATILKETVKNGKTAIDKDTGEIITVTPDAATLNVVRQFLKDTGTTVAPGSHETVNDIAASLPFSGSPEHDEDLSRH